MNELAKREKPSADISKVTDGLNAFDALKAAAKAIASESPEILTGVLGAVLPPVLPVVRLFHAGAKNNLIKQVVVEVEELRKKGAINEEYLKTEEAHSCFSDLLDAIDRTSPDSKRYGAMRTAFLRVMGRGEIGKGGVHAQQLLRVIYELSAGEIAVLAAVYTMGSGGTVTIRTWLSDVANNSGILRSELVEEIETGLMRKRIIFQRRDGTPRVGSGYEGDNILKWGQRNRLTTLGQEVCETFMNLPA